MLPLLLGTDLFIWIFKTPTQHYGGLYRPKGSLHLIYLDPKIFFFGSYYSTFYGTAKNLGFVIYACCPTPLESVYSMDLHSTFSTLFNLSACQ